MNKQTKQIIGYTNVSIFLFMGIASVAFSQNANWTKYESEEGKVEISFPASFTEETTEKENAIINKVSCNFNNNVFFFSYTIHSIQLANPYELAEVSLESFVNGVNGKIINQEIYEINNKKGIRSLIEIEDKSTIMEYIVIINNQIQYQVVALTSIEKADLKMAKKFFKSFKIE